MGDEALTVSPNRLGAHHRGPSACHRL